MTALDLRRKIGQLMVFGFKGITASDEIKDLIRDYHVGGIILFGRNIGTPKEILELTTELQQEAKNSGHELPLLICTDQENGVVRRLGDGTTVFPGAMLLGATKNPDYAYHIGVATGKELKALGINWNLAPVLDVNNNPLNPVIGVRSYGESANHVSDFGKAAMKGLQDAGIITTLKHFPGHGDTELDSHLDLPVIAHDMKRLQEIELKPFVECINEGADTVMSAHVYFPTIEKNPGVPATLSRAVITGLLREQLSFDGVVTTDCLEMNAISKTIGTAQGAVQAIKAGVDLIMISHLHNLQKDAFEEIVKAVESGEIEEKLIDEALARVTKLKQKYLSWSETGIMRSNDGVPKVVGSKEHQQQALEVFRQGITIVKNNEGILPLSKAPNHRVFVIYPENSAIKLVEDLRYSYYALGELIKEIHPAADTLLTPNPVSDEQIFEIIEQAADYDTVVVGTLTALPGSQQVKLIEGLYNKGKKIVVIAMRSPYDLRFLPDIQGYIATYEFTYPALQMAVKALYGEEEVKGELPVTIIDQT